MRNCLRGRNTSLLDCQNCIRGTAGSAIRNVHTKNQFGCASSKALIWKSEMLLRCPSLATNWFLSEAKLLCFCSKIDLDRAWLISIDLDLHLDDCWSGIRTRKIFLSANQKDYDSSETSIGKLSTRRIQIYPDYFWLGNILKVLLNNFQNNA